MLSLIVGLAVMGLSLWGMSRWWAEFAFVMRGFLPLCFLMGGLVAVIAGASSFGSKPPADPAKKP